MSYVVKNCPAYDYEKEYDYHSCKQHLVPYEGNVDDCQNCTNCVIKQVIEKCKEVENIENVKTLYDAAQSGMFLQANRILKLLDIEEVKE